MVDTGYGLFFIDSDFGIQKTSRRLMDNLELDNEKGMIGKKCYHLFYNLNQPCRNCPVPRAIAYKINVEEDVVQNPAADDALTRHASATPILDNDGQVRRVIVDCLGSSVAQPLKTDLVRDDDVPRNGTIFSTKSTNSPATKTILLDHDLTVILYNEGARKLFSDLEPNIVGKDLFAASPYYNRPHIRNRIKDFVLYDDAPELFFDSPDDAEHVSQHHVIRLGLHSQMQTILITSSAKPHNGILEKRIVKDRTKKISQFASQMAHDIKNPLALISTNVEFIRRDMEQCGDDKNNSLNYANAIQQQVQEIVGILDSANTLKIHSMDVVAESDIAQLLNRVVTVSLLSKPYSTNTIDSSVGENLPRILTSELYLERALTELLKSVLMNAGKDGALNIELDYKGDDNDEFILTIRSNRSLTGSIDLERIVSEFPPSRKKLDSMTTGLIIAYATVLALDGLMDVEHSASGDLRIIIKLPRVPHSS